MPRLLVTTAEPRGWRSDVPLLFIGEWCRLPDQRARWERLDAETMPYHWDDRERFRADYAYLNACYERLLPRLANMLNTRHGTAHGIRYWRILLGPWLYLFIHVLYDRWEMVRRASLRSDIASTIILADPEQELIPRDLAGMSPDDLRWNHFLYACAIREQGTIPIEELPGQSFGLMQSTAPVDRSSGIKEALKRAVGWLLRYFTSQNEALFLHTHIPRVMESRLQLRLGQIPKAWRSPPVPQVAPDLEMRKALKTCLADVDDDAFQSFLSTMTVRQIPTCYLEGLGALQKTVRSLPWPRRPKVIFTSNAFQFDEVFQLWAAERTEQGSPLVIGQHGGFYGVGKVVAGEDHQVAIADRFLTWGWQDSRPSIYSCVALTNLEREAGTWNPGGDLLLVTVPIRMVSFKCSSWAVAANQSQAFLADQLHFASALDDAVRRKLVLRIHQRIDEKLRCSFIPQWKNRFPSVEIDPSVTPIEDRIRDCRLFVYTYNSTGFLETLARDIPTVVFWNVAHWELRDAAKPYFDMLSEVGIFHSDPATAAAHVNHVWSDVNAWWSRREVQQAREAFCAAYVRSADDPLSELEAALTF